MVNNWIGWSFADSRLLDRWESEVKTIIYACCSDIATIPHIADVLFMPCCIFTFRLFRVYSMSFTSRLYIYVWSTYRSHDPIMRRVYLSWSVSFIHVMCAQRVYLHLHNILVIIVMLRVCNGMEAEMTLYTIGVYQEYCCSCLLWSALCLKIVCYLHKQLKLNKVTHRWTGVERRITG